MRSYLQQLQFHESSKQDKHIGNLHFSKQKIAPAASGSCNAISSYLVTI